ncbi:unnamed protein product [Mytilus edulis]|uniref:Uncharacterized protein n=1 Tax=Mytilus edulis TaxID=6550 RepID=A0A8S3VGE1_MYTED|nr:unnamed protein product [Mytilus edulis]
MKEAGIDISLFQAYSCRMVSPSKAAMSGISMDDILSMADRSNTRTFNKFYFRTNEKAGFADNVLEMDNLTRREVASEVISSVFNSYTTEVPVISSLLCSGDDIIYFMCNKLEEKSLLVKGKMLKSSIRTLQTLEKQIFDMALNKEVDWTCKDFSGRIVAVDVNGRLKFTYNGNTDLNAFFPNGIAITPSDKIILSDYKQNALHVLNSIGELLGLHFIDKVYNIENPSSLCFDSEGYLLIGNGLLNDSDGKIYVTKIADNYM